MSSRGRSTQKNFLTTLHPLTFPAKIYCPCSSDKPQTSWSKQGTARNTAILCFLYTEHAVKNLTQLFHCTKVFLFRWIELQITSQITGMAVFYRVSKAIVPSFCFCVTGLSDWIKHLRLHCQPISLPPVHFPARSFASRLAYLIAHVSCFGRSNIFGSEPFNWKPLPCYFVEFCRFRKVEFMIRLLRTAFHFLSFSFVLGFFYSLS